MIIGSALMVLSSSSWYSMHHYFANSSITVVLMKFFCVNLHQIFGAEQKHLAQPTTISSN
ncbi:hypothetical protein [Iningainema tapete]|uniref:hypothetical protein n=1 Tax=Iningainema tapete TaxID=2806730 RepID=UPI001EE32B0D|nr:hypothetical protein [Iningainema tapete]